MRKLAFRTPRAHIATEVRISRWSYSEVGLHPLVEARIHAIRKNVATLALRPPGKLPARTVTL